METTGITENFNKTENNIAPRFAQKSVYRKKMNCHELLTSPTDQLTRKIEILY